MKDNIFNVVRKIKFLDKRKIQDGKKVPNNGKN